MYNLKLETKNRELELFLKVRKEEENKDLYQFNSIQNAAETLGKYILYDLKKETIEEMIRRKKAKTEDKEEIKKCLSQKKLQMILECIQYTLLYYLKDAEKFNYEGFVSFRLKKEKSLLKKEFYHAYELFIHQDGSDSTEFLKQLMINQESIENEMKLSVTKSKVVLKGENKIYFMGEITKEDYEVEDEIISQLILASPKRIKIVDKDEVLSKQTVRMLMEIFRERVMFFGENVSN